MLVFMTEKGTVKCGKDFCVCCHGDKTHDGQEYPGLCGGKSGFLEEMEDLLEELENLF